MDDHYRQRELLEAIKTVVKNQAALSSDYNEGSSVVIRNIENYMSADEKYDYSNFRAFIDAYDMILTFLGLSLGVNILCLGFSEKLPQNKTQL
ncbi:hypothetical protein, partial [Salinivibrio sp. MA607]|uniref:hypothetical protein n=1 Tax=Salinivibrio sp. MA607 TaxID=1909457 RepID=UPI001056C3B1